MQGGAESGSGGAAAPSPDCPRGSREGRRLCGDPGGRDCPPSKARHVRPPCPPPGGGPATQRALRVHQEAPEGRPAASGGGRFGAQRGRRDEPLQLAGALELFAAERGGGGCGGGGEQRQATARG
eukprot:7919163-Pyramimonas_sp.AAC.1